MLAIESDMNLRGLRHQRGLSGVSHHAKTLRNFATWGLITVVIRELSKEDIGCWTTDCEPPNYNTKQKTKKLFPILSVAQDT